MDWNLLDFQLNPVMQWDLLLKHVLEILSVMCPFKKVNTKKPRSRWITPKMFRLIRTRKTLLKQFHQSKYPTLSVQIRAAHNRINAALDKAKETY